MVPPSIAGVVDVEQLGAGEGVDVVVEVPHGADRMTHFDALRARLSGRLPDGLHEFFAVNTDVGAWQLGRRVAERLAGGGWRVLALRCLVPRTFIDCNRIEEAVDELAGGGMTASVPSYVREPADRELLLGLHRQYVGAVEQALAALGPRGFLFMPHTYGPVTLGIERVDDDIVTNLRAAHADLARWPVRPEVDLITRTADGAMHAAPAVVERVAAAYRAAGVQVGDNATYHMHPATLGHRWATRLPGRTFSLEIRRDLLVREWTWNRENQVDPGAVDRFAAPIAAAIGEWLREEG
jgi:predicted N-formylglutamate amidohydrolase